MFGDLRIRKSAMVRNDHRHVERAKRLRRKRNRRQRKPAGRLDLGNMRIAIGQMLDPAPRQQFHNAERRRLPGVRNIPLERHAQHKHPRFGQGHRESRNGPHDGLRHVMRHRLVNPCRKRNERRLEIVPPGHPGQVIRVHGNAMAAQSGARQKRHEAKRLGGRRLHHFPNRNIAHPVA